jgi:hypothetical protein
MTSRGMVAQAILLAARIGTRHVPSARLRLHSPYLDTAATPTPATLVLSARGDDPGLPDGWDENPGRSGFPR